MYRQKTFSAHSDPFYILFTAKFRKVFKQWDRRHQTIFIDNDICGIFIIFASKNFNKFASLILVSYLIPLERIKRLLECISVDLFISHLLCEKSWIFCKVLIDLQDEWLHPWCYWQFDQIMLSNIVFFMNNL